MKKCINCKKNFEPHKFAKTHQKYCSSKCRYSIIWLKTRLKKKELLQERRKEAIKILGGKCIICNINNLFCLAIDHKNDDGYKDINGRALYNRIINNPETSKQNLQILCHNHNQMKSSYPEEYKKEFNLKYKNINTSAS